MNSFAPNVWRFMQVPFSRSSLNHFDVFILDTASKIFLFSGYNSSVQERARALEVVQFINENRHNRNCEVATIGKNLYLPPTSPPIALFSWLDMETSNSTTTEDGKFVSDPDAGEFWSLFGGYAPIPRDSPSAFPEKENSHSIKLFR